MRTLAPSTLRNGGRLRRALSVAASAALVTALLAVPASANLPGSTFEGSDGNMVVDTASNLDWANVPGVVKGNDLPSGSADNAFGNGTKENDPNVTIVPGSIPPNKNDLTHYYVADGLATNGHVMLYLAWERTNTSGSANIDFEINQVPQTWAGTSGAVKIVRTPGDLLISYDFSGSGTPTLSYSVWNGTAWVSQGTLSNVEAAVNSTTITDPFTKEVLKPLQFGEAAIDLTASGVFPAGQCESFGSVFVKSRASASINAEVKDFIAPQKVSISNCSSLTVKKVTQNDPGANQPFSFTSSVSDASSFTLAGGESKLLSSKLNSGTYTVKEGSVPADWSFVGVKCTNTADGSPYEAVSYDGATAKVDLKLMQDVTCTYTNHYTNQPKLSTVLSSSTATVGDAVHDTSTLSGATSDASGTVTYTVFSDDKCSAKLADAGTGKVVDGVVGDSTAVTFDNAGTYYWQATYSGDANNAKATSPCTEEKLVVDKIQPSITTVLQPAAIVVNGSTYDTAKLTNATATAGGTVTYTVFADKACTSVYDTPETVTVKDAAVPNSAPVTFANAGGYWFQASYSGDANNKPATSACTEEPLTVDKATTSITTKLSTDQMMAGGTMHDPATLSGATANAGGTVTYKVFTDDKCSALSAADPGTAAVNNGVVGNSKDVTFNDPGTYYFQAEYSGDANNKASASACIEEQLVVTKYTPKVSTLLSGTKVTVGGSIHDTATMTGASADASGTVTYAVFSDSGCSAKFADVAGGAVTNGVLPDSAPLAFTAAGAYYWSAIYSGDAKNEPYTSPCTEEPLTVDKMVSSATTAQNQLPNDTFTFTSAYNPTGSVNFKLYAPSDATCAGTPVYSQDATVSGMAAATTNTTFHASEPGTWRWLVTYAGDVNNTGFTSACGVEQFTINNSATG